MVGGANVGATIPNNNQGWGRINLGNVFSTSVSKVFHDQDHTIVATGEEVLYNISVFNTSEPVKISLVWSDAPGAIGVSPSLVNNLDLRVVNSGNTYLGNVMTSGWSTTGGAADALNNIENVYIQNPGATLQIFVTASNIAGDGIPYNGDATDQDFALLCTNCTASPDYSLVTTPSAQQICIGSNAIFTVTTTSLNGYTDSVTLAASGEPVGTSKNFSVNPITPGANSILTIGSTGGAASGVYSILVSGASTSGSHNDISTLTLASLNDTTTLSTPLNGHKHTPLQPAFSWAAVTGAASYDIQIATDSGFNNIVSSAAGLAATSFSPAGQLTSNTLYYWRVRVNNTCGAANYSSSNHFVTINTSAPSVSYCNNTAANIPDNSANGVFSQITIPDSGTIVDMDVIISGTHSWVGDLGFTISDVLFNPSTPISVTVIDRPGYTNSGFGCGGNNFNVILSDEAATSVETTCSGTPPALQGTVKPNNLLSNFDGKSVTGEWRIKATDFASPDAGILQKWCLNISLASNNVFTHPTDPSCGGNTPCFSGSGAIQQAINAAADGGRVNILGSQTINSPLTCVNNVIVSGSADMTSSITWTGGTGSLFVAETGCSLTVKGLTIDGANQTSAFTANGSASITAYANNFSNITGSYNGTGTPAIGHNYWGTSAADAATPAGMPVSEWPKRLGAPIQNWGDGEGSAAVTSASLSGGTGTAVIVDLGTTPPFGNGVSGYSEKMCSPYFDFFLLNGSGTWTASIPVAGGTNCTDNTLTPKRLYTIGEIANCSPSTNGACWIGILPGSLTTVTNNLVYGGLTSSMLNGTYFVAGSESGDRSNQHKITDFLRERQQYNRFRIYWTITIDCPGRNRILVVANKTGKIIRKFYS